MGIPLVNGCVPQRSRQDLSPATSHLRANRSYLISFHGCGRTDAWTGSLGGSTRVEPCLRTRKTMPAGKTAIGQAIGPAIALAGHRNFRAIEPAFAFCC